jgi:hypothetical protein
MDDQRPDERIERAERGERTELVDFAPAQVGGSRRRNLGPIVAAAWAVVLAVVVGVGIVGHRGFGSAAPSGAPAALGLLPSAVANMFPAVASQGPNRSSDPNPLAVQVAPGAGKIAVSGTVRSRSVVSVLVSIEYADGSVSWQSLSIHEGGLQAVSGPSFVVQFELAEPVTDVVWVEANAYNDLGRKIGSVRRPGGQPTDRSVVPAKASLVR